MIITQSWRKPATLLGAAIIAGSGIITGAAPRHVAHAAPAIPNGGTVIAAEAETPDTLNPYLTQTLSATDIDSPIFDSLVKDNPSGKFVNDLATSYSHDASGLHWTFNIVHNATWQDGQPLTAKDIVFTTQLDNNPKFPSTSTQGFDHVKSIKAVGNYQVDVTLKSVYAPFLQYWATAFILPEHVLGTVSADKVKTLTSFNQKPLGSGPFKITEYASGDHITEVANKSYFGGAPHLDKIIYRIVPNSNTVINQMQTGEINLLGQTSSLTARQFNVLKKLSGITTYNTQGFNWNHVDLVETGFLKDRTVRQALAYATPKQQIIKSVVLGYGLIDDGDKPPMTTYYNSATKDSYPYNLVKAKSLLLADGFKAGSNGIVQKGGKPFNLTLWATSDAADAQLIIQILKQTWGQIGVNVTLKTAAASIVFGRSGPLYDPNRFSSPTMNAVFYEWIQSPEPDDTFFWNSSQIVSSKVAAGGNFDGYSNPQIDQLTNQGVKTLDTGQRVAIYGKISTILVKDQPDIFIYWGRVLTAATSKLHGYNPQPYDYQLGWNAKDWYMSS